MNLFKEISKLWNDNFNKGVTVFQMCLMGSMILGAVMNNEPAVLFSMTACLLAYFEPTEDRLSINGWYRKDKKTNKEVRT